MLQRVHIVGYLRKTLSACVVGERRSVSHVEVGVEVEHYLFMHERLTTVRHRSAACHLLRLHVLEPLATPQREQQMLLLGCRLQHTRVGKYYRLVFVRAGHAVYHDAVEFAGVHVLLRDVDVRVWYAVVEHAFGYLQFWTFLLHRHQHHGELAVGFGSDGILEVDGEHADSQTDGYERAESLHERDAGGFNGCKL